MWWELWLGATAAFALFAMVRREKTDPDNASKNPVRRKILDFLARKPGARLDALWKAAGVSRTTTQYHVVVLRRVGQVQAIGTNGENRYFPPDWHPQEAEAVSLVLRGRIFDLAALLLRQPGFCQKDAVRMLRISRNAFHDYVSLLEGQHLVEKERDRKMKRYYPTSQLFGVMELATRIRDGGLEPGPADGGGDEL